ncbi:peptidoglycan-binding domain-containing protein [Nodosilinea sp. PGN35]|uniref:peptidoglycan-binding domain-containing protein n=1 Tax=Nodosilinea sp. PGN35 TaxID=3020489 RepID=UPI0023B25E35|nr:peptidoglycan-binding domain-containing protein [Nodosilinea sp. TSF1-S3]MDF0365553.1 peptidoglycan-binding domain-containing protein [Nodosilinea sp. TSF1-S3]
MTLEHATAPLDQPLTADDLGTTLVDRLLGQGENPLDDLSQALRRHRATLIDYCTLALQPQLSAPDETRLGAILDQAVDDPWLSFWLDEADGWVSEHLQLLPEEALRQQQSKLRRTLSQTWVDTFWNDLQHRTKALQTYLKRVGVYSGAIDGIMGPTTQRAVESLKTAYPDGLPLGYL